MLSPMSNVVKLPPRLLGEATCTTAVTDHRNIAQKGVCVAAGFGRAQSTDDTVAPSESLVEFVRKKTVAFRSGNAGATSGTVVVFAATTIYM